MAEERYSKNDILNIPDLSPTRDYYSEGVKTSGSSYVVPMTPNRFFQTIDDLDGVYDMASLLPPELADIIRAITDVLSVDTQGKMILKMEREKKNEGDTDDNKNETPNDSYNTIKPTTYDDTRTDDDDIFSTKPAFKIQIIPSNSLVRVAQNAYEQDDLDIKNYYIGRMTDISSRFFQIMTTLAMEAGMPDYSYLMQDFDGTAVKTDDPNQQHLIDMISKDQIIYDQKLRQMNLTHTARNTLIMTRGLTAAEGQRERYLGERYKENLNDTASAMSNDMLQRSREQAEAKYQNAAYNLYKYLDGATKATNTLLNLKIDEAAAKTQLANTGSDIYAYTPPTPATENHIDDNFETSIKAEDKGQKFVDEQKKDSVTGKEASSGGASADGGSSGGGSSYTGPLGGGNVEPEVIFKWLKGKGYSTIAACAILGSIQQESGFNTGATNPSSGAYGLCQWLGNRKDDGNGYGLIPFAQSRNSDPGDAGVQMDWFWEELQQNKSFYDESQPESLNQCTDIQSAAMQFYNNFERGGASQIDGRIGYAEQFYEKFQGQ